MYHPLSYYCAHVSSACEAIALRLGSATLEVTSVLLDSSLVKLLLFLSIFREVNAILMD